MNNRVYITSIGITSAIGSNVEENLNSLKSYKSGIGKLDILETKYRDEYLAGEIKIINQELAGQLNIDPHLIYPRTTLLAIKAAKEAYNNSFTGSDKKYRTGLIAGTTVGGMDKTEKYYYNPNKNTDFIKSHSCGSITEQIADYLNISDFITTINTACSSSANAIMQGVRMIKMGMLDRVVAGGYDSLSKFTLNGFRSLFILAKEGCKPFDEDRDGLNLGEGAGFVVLESEKIVEEQGKSPLCLVSGYANANDAFHQTASSEEGTGAKLSIRNAIRCAGLSPSDISYINVHGTGTENNDLSEGMALKSIFKEYLPPFSSTKSFTGHTLGAAGGIEAVYSVLSIRDQLIFPNLNFSKPIKKLGLYPERHLVENTQIKHVMSNSFGFGGNDTTLIFSRN
ncbi:MAG: beta-ketoacyl-[acyl-carrier-protein] synthase family protein [Bacteroidales bacterium]|nr:beta-ketoacyl-[acyl-carrier-protein] synthase family protein [Bacteroidales bacterium]